MVGKNIQLQLLGKHTKVNFKVIILCLFVFVGNIDCCAQEYNAFINKFKLVELPIDLASLERYKEISKDEFMSFLNLDSIEWPFKDEYFYFTLVRFRLNNFEGLIFERVNESSDESEDYKIEDVLCIFNKNGILQSSIVVGGSCLKGEKEVNIDGSFQSNFMIKIEKNEFLNGEKEKKIINYYRIDSTNGKILIQ